MTATHPKFAPGPAEGHAGREFEFGMGATSALQRTPLYERHVALGAKMVAFAGWEMPIQYPSGIVAEHRAVRSAAGLFDLSHMGELFFRGAGAGSALDRLVSSDIAGLAPGQARYGLLCNERGMIVDDVIVYRLAGDSYLMVVNAANIGKDREHIRAHLDGDADLDDRSSDTALVAIQGPRAVEMLAPLTRADASLGLGELPPFGVTTARVAGSRAHVARTGYTGEDGFEIFVASADAEAPWARLLEAGAAAGLVPVGLGARDTLRLEARFSLYGNEIDETTDPIEAGLAWTCKVDKDFLGRDPIAAAKERGPRRRIVGLVVEGGIARHGHPVVADGTEIGHVTSGTYGPTVQKNIALAYVPAELSKVGTRLQVRVRDRDLSATVVRTPFYRREATT